MQRLSQEIRSNRWFVGLFGIAAVLAAAFCVWCALLFNAAGSLPSELGGRVRLLSVAALLLVASNLGLVIFAYVSRLRLQRAQREQPDTGHRDALTGLLSRSAIHEVLERELVRIARLREDLAVCLLEPDHFGDVYEQLGRAAGDAVLRDTAQWIAGLLRPYDSIGRYGGEQLLILVPGSKRAGAQGLAERIRKSVEQHRVEVGRDQVTVSVSIGVAACGPEESATADDLIRLAEQALQEAKETGRNRVVAIRLP